MKPNFLSKLGNLNIHNLLICISGTKILNRITAWLWRFVLEVHKQNGSDYPRVLYSLCVDYCFICERKTFNLNFLDERDDLIAVFRKVLDVCMKELLSKGSGTKVRQVDSIMPEDEEKIWTRGVHRI